MEDEREVLFFFLHGKMREKVSLWISAAALR